MLEPGYREALQHQHARHARTLTAARAEVAWPWMGRLTRKADARLPGKGNSKSFGVRPVLQMVSMMDQ
jgi:hypothetical protein